ncbi:MAG: prepilin-type N-terminal cleavage/methylation domain-containing protein [Hylemonella sp.]|nr:prepilin-type N-terminal cleavage/methylation domain-containing protein [Hylemonella sp.]MDH5709082.1 prepilin-type N-terminal cleavage/methylation domain-containing protein [Hylemonella sp.]
MKAATQRGFTLVEMLITVAIIGILAAIAIPSYNKYIVRAKRSAAQSFMLSVANKQEQYLLDRRTYAADLAALNMTVPADVAQNYTITTTPDMAVAPPVYSVKAEPIGTQATIDTKCGTLTLHSITGKSVSTATPVASCW